MSRIVYIKQLPLQTHEVERFGMDFFALKGFEVDVLDVGELVLPQMEHERSHYEQMGAFRPTVLRTRRDLADRHGLLGDADLIVMLAGAGGVNRRNLPVFRAVNKAGRPSLMLSTNAFPGFDRMRTQPIWSRSRISDALHRYRNGYLNPVNSVIARLPRRMLGTSYASSIVFGGRASLNQQDNVGPTTKAILAHAMDYETVRRRGLSPTESNTAVFIDQNLPFFRDGRAFGDEPRHVAVPYFTTLDRFFSEIERRFGLDVVIAAAPSADYRAHPEAFGGRQVIYGQTPELVAKSRLVIGHRSTAMSYAVIFHKPVQIVTTEAIYGLYSQVFTVDTFAKEFGRPLLMIDQPQAIDFGNFFDLDRAAYDRYFDRYIKMNESRDAPLWEIVYGDLVANQILH